MKKEKKIYSKLKKLENKRKNIIIKIKKLDEEISKDINILKQYIRKECKEKN